jgi:hypothetical protein
VLLQFYWLADRRLFDWKTRNEALRGMNNKLPRFADSDTSNIVVSSVFLQTAMVVL